MSSIVTDQGIVHYETYGQGSPVVLLHGWLGSWDTWHTTMESLGRHYRTYGLDFWGFGESGKKRATYAVSDFVELVDQFMDRLGIAAAPIVGHSMGGTVGLSVAIRYPRRAQKVAVVGAPLVGSSLSIFLRLAGYKPIAFAAYNMPALLRLGLRAFAPLIARRHVEWYAMQKRDLSRTSLESFLLSIASLRRTDLRPRLGEVTIPVMGVYGTRDTIVDPGQHKVLAECVRHARVEVMPGSTHFPMLDDADQFNALLKSFLDGNA